MKACLLALGTKMAFSHALDITNETNGLHYSLLHKTTADSMEASFTAFSYRQDVFQLLVAFLHPFQHFSSPIQQFPF